MRKTDKVCVCVCVGVGGCVCERERERERNSFNIPFLGMKKVADNATTFKAIFYNYSKLSYVDGFVGEKTENPVALHKTVTWKTDTVEYPKNYPTQESCHN